MILYHFTGAWNLPAILAAGQLDVTESNLCRGRAHAGPGVVWLTSNPDPDAHKWWLVPDGRECADKTAIRFTIEVPAREARRWQAWARARDIDPQWAARLAETGGAGSGSWYVIERPVARPEWVEITWSRTGEPAARKVART